MIVCILGRQPELSMAELEQIFSTVSWHGPSAALIDADHFDIQRVGGTTKAGRVTLQLPKLDWNGVSSRVMEHYVKQFKQSSGKLTLGISVYGREVPAREIQKLGLTVKTRLKTRDGSLRLIPNESVALSTATSHHNKLGLSPNKLELLIVFSDAGVIVAESMGTQNITALAARDQGRPKRDAFVGMLPPKLALMMVNMAGSTLGDITAKPLATKTDAKRTVLDPFCGTGVVLQEAALLGYDVYGSDLSEKMVDYSRLNLEWLKAKHSIGKVRIEAGDAIEHTWQPPIDVVVAETYLGQPFSAPPAPDKLAKVVRITNDIITKFLTNLSSQIKPGTPLCIAVPAWRDNQGHFTYLPLTQNLARFGYEWQRLKSVDVKRLAYYRDDQIVARQLLLLIKK